MRLTEMEYLLLHGGSRGHLLRNELLWDGGSVEENHLCGLLNVEDGEGSHRKLDDTQSKFPPSCGHVGAKLGSKKTDLEQAAEGLSSEVVGANKNAVIRVKKKMPLSPSPLLSNSSS
ncbi:hypothetical protein [Rosenbergiella epipactidis]|uniref:hypothetical protein n=1 Tax=Rosenbergiella epipactidis TaxID=1544694 RepID=UPI0032AEDC12